MGLGEAKVVRGMLAGALIGVFIAARSTFAAEVGGCQAECGAASGMAAAALVTLADGTAGQAAAAAAMALQNVFGLVCDPVAGRVEVPCLGKNVLAAGNALTAANMALADFDPVVPLDEVITAMDQVGRSLPGRCAARPGEGCRSPRPRGRSKNGSPAAEVPVLHESPSRPPPSPTGGIAADARCPFRQPAMTLPVSPTSSCNRRLKATTPCLGRSQDLKYASCHFASSCVSFCYH